MRRRFTLTLGVLTLATLTTTGSVLGVAHAADQATKNVLMLCGQRPDLPAVRLVEEGLREVLGAATSKCGKEVLGN